MPSVQLPPRSAVNFVKEQLDRIPQSIRAGVPLEQSESSPIGVPALQIAEEQRSLQRQGGFFPTLQAGAIDMLSPNNVAQTALDFVPGGAALTTADGVYSGIESVPGILELIKTDPSAAAAQLLLLGGPSAIHAGIGKAHAIGNAPVVRKAARNAAILSHMITSDARRTAPSATQQGGGGVSTSAKPRPGATARVIPHAKPTVDAERTRATDVVFTDPFWVAPVGTPLETPADIAFANPYEIAPAESLRFRQTEAPSPHSTIPDDSNTPYTRIIRNRDDVEASLLDPNLNFGYTPKEARAVANIYESIARAWAKRTGKKPEDWYTSFLPGATANAEVIARQIETEFDRKISLEGKRGAVIATNLYDPATGAVSWDKVKRNPSDLRSVLVTLKSANKSTGLHELGHLFIESTKDAPGFEVISEWVGAKPGEAFTREQHEKFALAMERYFRDGKAPNKSLKSVFETFKSFMREIYRTVGDIGGRGGKIKAEAFSPEMKAFLKEHFGDVSDLTGEGINKNGTGRTRTNPGASNTNGAVGDAESGRGRRTTDLGTARRTDTGGRLPAQGSGAVTTGTTPTRVRAEIADGATAELPIVQNVGRRRTGTAEPARQSASFAREQSLKPTAPAKAGATDQLDGVHFQSGNPQIPQYGKERPKTNREYREQYKAIYGKDPGPNIKMKRGNNPFVASWEDIDQFRDPITGKIWAMVVHGDTARADPYEASDGSQVMMHGGAKLGTSQDRYGYTSWASRGKSPDTNLQKNRHLSRGLGIVVAGAPETVLTSVHGANAYNLEISAVINNNPSFEPHVLGVLQEAFEMAKLTKPASIADAKTALLKLTFQQQGKLMSFLKATKRGEALTIHQHDIIKRMIDPDYASANTGDAVSALYFDEKPSGSASHFGVTAHPAYGLYNGGMMLGDLLTHVPLHILAKPSYDRWLVEETVRYNKWTNLSDAQRTAR